MATKQIPSAPTDTPEPPGIAAVKEVLEVHAVGVLVSKALDTKTRDKTAGEVMFDRVVYTGIGFGVNEASSLWITDQFLHGKPKWYLGGKPFSKDGFEAATKTIAKTFNMTHAKSGNALLMATLLSGGTLLVLPMRALEEHKIYWTEKANHFIDWFKGNKMVAEDVATRDEEVKQAIACSPQQTWAALLVGRAAAMGASFMTGNYIVKEHGNKKIMDFSEKHLTTAAKAVGLEKTANTDTFKRYARLTGIETYSCLISSGVLEIVSKLFAKRGTEVHDAEICNAAHPKEEAAAATSTTATGSSENTDTKKCTDKIRPCPITASKMVATPSSYVEKIKSEKGTAPATLAV